MKKIFTIVASILLIMTFTSCTNITKANGEFYCDMLTTNEKGITDVYYQFKSYDNKTWWFLTADEMGFVPVYNTEYIVIYDNNGTTSENINCGCPAEWECECDVYDDVFIKVVKK